MARPALPHIMNHIKDPKYKLCDTLNEFFSSTGTPIGTYKDAWRDIDFEVDTVYLITWNPKPSFYGYDTAGYNNFDVQWWTMIRQLCKHIRCLEKYALVPEVSDCGKLHLHGWYVVKDKRKYKRGFLPSLRATGFIKIGKVNKHQWKTYRYHIKDLNDGSTAELMDPVVLTHNTHDVIKQYYDRIELFAPVVETKSEKLRKSVLTYLAKEIADEDDTSEESFSL